MQEKCKHCQRHNGPEDWVHLTKVSSWVHFTNSNTNLDQISSSESRPSINFKISTKILTKPCAQRLNKSLALWTILSSQICNKLLPIQSSSSTLATVTISTSFELVSSHARVTSIKFTKQEWVSESVSHWQALPMIGLGSDKKNEVSRLTFDDFWWDEGKRNFFSNTLKSEAFQNIWIKPNE